MNELGDIKGLVLVAVSGVCGLVAGFLKFATVQFASIASEFMSKEILPWMTGIGIVVTVTMAILNRRDKLRAMKKHQIEPTDSP